MPRVEAAPEADWCYNRAFGAASVTELCQGTGLQLLPLSTLAAKLSHLGMDRLWPPEQTAEPGKEEPAAERPARIWCTPNFALTVRGGSAHGQYLHPLSGVLLLPDGAAVLISERKCNGLLEVAWQHGPLAAKGGNPASPVLALLSFATVAAHPTAGSRAPAPLRLATALRTGRHGWAQVGDLQSRVQDGGFLRELTSMQLFNGASTYIRWVTCPLFLPWSVPWC